VSPPPAHDLLSSAPASGGGGHHHTGGTGGLLAALLLQVGGPTLASAERHLGFGALAATALLGGVAYLLIKRGHPLGRRLVSQPSFLRRSAAGSAAGAASHELPLAGSAGGDDAVGGGAASLSALLGGGTPEGPLDVPAASVGGAVTGGGAGVGDDAFHARLVKKSS